MKKYIINFLKGAVIGASMTVPGVSGGAMAIILDLYDKLVHSMSNLFKNFKENFLFILSVALGGLTGLFAFAHVMKKLLEVFQLPIIYLFMGCILGSIPLVLFKAKESKDHKFKFDWKTIVFPLIGCAIVIGLSFLPTNNDFEFTKDFSSIFYVLLTGVIISISLVLPGLSTTFMLLVLGVYNYFLDAITNFDILFIGLLAIGVLIGFIITIKVVDILMKKYPKPVFLTILGFVVGSIYTIFPGFPTGMNILYCILLFILGFIPLLFISIKSGGKE